jgi:excisionase family DNA binding protein
MRDSGGDEEPRIAAAPLLTIVEAAAVLRVPEGWLRKKVSAGVVPHTRLGKHVRFSSDQLRRIVLSGEVQPVEPTVRPTGVSRHARRRHVDPSPPG